MRQHGVVSRKQLVQLGALPHEIARMARRRELVRDLDTLVDSDRPTVRLTYGLVFGTPCQTVAKVAAILGRRGWRGTIRRCPACPGAA